MGTSLKDNQYLASLNIILNLIDVQRALKTRLSSNILILYLTSSVEKIEKLEEEFK